MKKWWVVALIFSLLIAGTVLTGGCASVNPVAESQTIVVDVSAGEAHTLIQENQGDASFVILDVRTPEEYDEGHIEGAVNLNFYDDDYREQLENLDRDDTYLLFCRSGNRSGQTLDIMEELEFMTIYHMTGGMNEWNGEGLPVVR